MLPLSLYPVVCSPISLSSLLWIPASYRNSCPWQCVAEIFRDLVTGNRQVWYSATAESSEGRGPSVLDVISWKQYHIHYSQLSLWKACLENVTAHQA